MPVNMIKPSTVLSREEMNELLTKSDWRGVQEFLHTWVWIAFAFLLAGCFPNPFTIIAALFILGGKQLACAILMHDASHYSLFKNRKANDFFGNWFAAYLIFHDVKRYRPYHLMHHTMTGTEDDPDINLTRGYPTSILSMVRKFARDLFGITGIKGQFGVMAMHLGFLEYNLGNKIIKIPQEGRTAKEFIKTAVQNLYGPVLANLILFGILWACGAPWLYLLWWGASLTTYNLCVRVRSISEHSVSPNPLDPKKNTRTTYSGFLSELLFAPHYVNYHAEHHLLMNAPCYQYPKLHKMLLEKGFYKEGLKADNYWEILKMAAGKSKPDPAS